VHGQGGIEEVLLVTGGNNSGSSFGLLGKWERVWAEEFELHVSGGCRGIAQALDWPSILAGGDSILLILGDNILEYTIKEACKKFRHQGQGRRFCYLKLRIPGVWRGGNGGERVVKIVEKPPIPRAIAVIGIYFTMRRCLTS